MEAWDIYREFSDVDAIISDWVMPRMHGLELCNKVRGTTEGPETVTFFVFLTDLGQRTRLEVLAGRGRRLLGGAL